MSDLSLLKENDMKLPVKIATGSYFYSYDGQKVYDDVFADWLDGINAHKKTVFLSFPSSGGFSEEFEEKVTMVTSINYKV